MAQAESRLSGRIAKRIRDRGGYARKIHQGPHGAGILDIIFHYRGYGGQIETKMPGKEKNVTALQQETIDKLKAAGAIAVVMSSTAQADRLMDAIDRKRDKRVNSKGTARKGR